MAKTSPFDNALVYLYNKDTTMAESVAKANYAQFCFHMDDEGYRDNVIAAGATIDQFFNYFSWNNIDDAGTQSQLPPDTPYTPVAGHPRHNNLGYQPGDAVWIRDNHPEWFVHNGGLTITKPDNADFVFVDVGNTEFWDTWAMPLRLAPHMSTNGWKNIFLDNDGTDFFGGVTDEYGAADSAAWIAAKRVSMLRWRAYVDSIGGIFMTNMQGENFPLWVDFMQYLDQVMIEYYSKWGSGQKSVNDLKRDMAKVDVVSEMGKKAWCVIPVTNTAMDATQTGYMNFGIGLWLLACAPGAMLHIGKDYGKQTLFTTEINQWKKLGFPKDYRHEISTDVWERNFYNGKVTVNLSTRVATFTYDNATLPVGTQPPYVAPLTTTVSRIGEVIDRQLVAEDPQDLLLTYSLAPDSPDPLPNGIALTSGGRLTGTLTTPTITSQSVNGTTVKTIKIRYDLKFRVTNSNGVYSTVTLVWGIKPGECIWRFRNNGSAAPAVWFDNDTAVYEADQGTGTSGHTYRTQGGTISDGSNVGSGTLPTLGASAAPWLEGNEDVVNKFRFDTAGPPWVTYQVPLTTQQQDDYDQYVVVLHYEGGETAAGQRVYQQVVGSMIDTVDPFVIAGGNGKVGTKAYVTPDTAGKVVFGIQKGGTNHTPRIWSGEVYAFNEVAVDASVSVGAGASTVTPHSPSVSLTTQQVTGVTDSVHGAAVTPSVSLAGASVTLDAAGAAAVTAQTPGVSVSGVDVTLGAAGQVAVSGTVPDRIERVSANR